MGGAGDDELVGGGGNDELHGGAGADKADYSSATGSVRVIFGQDTSGSFFSVADDGYGDTDALDSIETIVGSQGQDEIDFSASDMAIWVRAGDEANDVEIDIGHNGAEGFMPLSAGVALEDFEKITATNHDDIISIQGTNWTPTNGVDPETIVLWEIDGADGDDEITFSGAGGKIYGGGGNDILDVDGYAAEMYGAAGADTFYFSDNVLVGDASGDDRMTLSGLIDLTGGVHWEGSESPWAYGLWGIKYGFNVDGEMVIESALFRNAAGDPLRTYVAGVSTADVGPGSVQADRPLGLYVITL